MRTIALVLMVTLGACAAADKTTAPSVTEVGRYALVSVDGQKLPAMVVEDDVTAEVFSGTFEVMSGGIAKISLEFRPIGEDMTTNAVSGRYTRRGDALSFIWETGGATTGLLSGDELQMTNDGQLWLFKRS